MLARMRLFAVLALLPILAPAQLDRSGLIGTVTAPGGARMPGATVKPFKPQPARNGKRERPSQGTYVQDGLPLGRYAILFRKSGLSAVRIDQLYQSVGQTRTLDAQLHVSVAAESTIVREQLVRLDTADTALGALIEQQQLREPPLNGRNWSSLTVLSPGAVDNGFGD